MAVLQAVGRARCGLAGLAAPVALAALVVGACEGAPQATALRDGADRQDGVPVARDAPGDRPDLTGEAPSLADGPTDGPLAGWNDGGSCDGITVADVSPDGPPDASADADAVASDGWDGSTPCAPIEFTMVPVPIDCQVVPDATWCDSPGDIDVYVFRSQECFDVSFGLSCAWFLFDPASEIDFGAYDLVEVCGGSYPQYCGCCGCVPPLEITAVSECPDGLLVNSLEWDPCGTCDACGWGGCLYFLVPNSPDPVTGNRTELEGCGPGG